MRPIPWPELLRTGEWSPSQLLKMKLAEVGFPTVDGRNQIDPALAAILPCLLTPDEVGEKLQQILAECDSRLLYHDVPWDRVADPPGNLIVGTVNGRMKGNFRYEVVCPPRNKESRAMKINKITAGFVIQTFDTKTGRCVKQEFIAGDNMHYRTRPVNPSNGRKSPMHSSRSAWFNRKVRNETPQFPSLRRRWPGSLAAASLAHPDQPAILHP